MPYRSLIESLSDAQLDTRAALNAHVGVVCVCAGRACARAYSTKLLLACRGANKQNETHRLGARIVTELQIDPN